MRGRRLYLWLPVLSIRLFFDSVECRNNVLSSIVLFDDNICLSGIPAGGLFLIGTMGVDIVPCTLGSSLSCCETADGGISGSSMRSTFLMR